MNTLPFEVRIEIEGWRLFWALLELQPADPELLRAVARAVVERITGQMRLDTLSSHATVAALRRLFRAAGCDPTRYRPSSEALLRRLLKGEGMPAIHPLVDLNNCLSACLAVPCCVMSEQALVPPFVLRAGKPGESYDSLRGPFNLEGRPLLNDSVGPCDTPITGGQRVKVNADSERVWLVAYLPAGVVEPAAAERELMEILQAAPVARVHLTGAS
jgi:DNA/RNA-binding domain of Phe-tRNA-synthetase-like protein